MPVDETTDAIEDRQRAALAVPTRRRVFDLIAAAPQPMTVGALAQALDVHDNTVRLHLAELMDAGLVVQIPAAVHGRGRPGFAYRAMADPRRREAGYRQLALWLARAARTGASPREIGREAGAAERQGEARNEPWEALVESFARMGFSPRSEPAGDDVDIVLDVCPFADVASEEAAAVCSLHVGLVEGLLTGTDVSVDRLDVVDAPHAGGCRVRLRTHQERSGGGGASSARPPKRDRTRPNGESAANE
jgi:predicted ArsR family transcriptional regulator